MGMGYQSISHYNAPPVFQTLVAQGQVMSPVFSFKLSSSGSELLLGGTNSDLYTGGFTYSPITTEGYWQITLQAVMLGNTAVLRNVQAIIDTGTTLVIAPASQARRFYAGIPGSKDASRTIGAGFYTFPCSAKPTVSLTFGSKPFAIDPALFNLGRVSSNSKECAGAIVGSAGLSFWVVGDAFLQNVYSTFDLDKNRVGFAKLK